MRGLTARHASEASAMTSNADRLDALDRQRAAMIDMAERAHRHVEYTLARRAAPLPTDDADKLAADVEAAQRDEAQYTDRAREIEREIVAIREAERQQRLAEARELARALVIDAKKADQAARTFARYEKAIVDLRQRLAGYEDVTSVPARYIEQRTYSHDMALAAAGIASDAALSRGPIDRCSYTDQVASWVAQLLDERTTEEPPRNQDARR